MLLILAGALCTGGAGALAGNFDIKIPMRVGSAATFYVPGRMADLAHTEFMVDTGSSITTINQPTLDELIAKGFTASPASTSGAACSGMWRQRFSTPSARYWV
jgi:hypothetical protein